MITQSKSNKRACPAWLENAWRDDAFICEQFRVNCGIAYARWLITQQRTSDALIIFSDLSVQAPNHIACAHAWYWLALEAQKSGDLTFRNECAHHLSLIAHSGSTFGEEWKFTIKAELLLHGYEQTVSNPLFCGFGTDLIGKVQAEIEENLAMLPSETWSNTI